MKSIRRCYKPSVVQAKTIGIHDDADRYALTMRQDVLTIRTGLAGEYVSEYRQIDPAHAVSITSSVRLQEISKFGSQNQELLDPDEGSGFIWRIYSQARYEEADGGVYLELEAAALSRSVPRALAWAVNPIIEKIARTALSTTLRQTRDAVIHEDVQNRAPGNQDFRSSSSFASKNSSERSSILR